MQEAYLFNASICLSFVLKSVIFAYYVVYDNWESPTLLASPMRISEFYILYSFICKTIDIVNFSNVITVDNMKRPSVVESGDQCDNLFAKTLSTALKAKEDRNAKHNLRGHGCPF
ncbi:MAG: hypothetical protein IJS52_01800, partial [Bacilli bacterium]|nr:hypothetical protein [Bacilli bacterium]